MFPIYTINRIIGFVWQEFYKVTKLLYIRNYKGYVSNFSVQQVDRQIIMGRRIQLDPEFLITEYNKRIIEKQVGLSYNGST